MRPIFACLLAVSVSLLPNDRSLQAAATHRKSPYSRVLASALFKVERIIVIGNTETSDGFILARLPFRTGSKINSHDLRIAQDRLLRLGLFQTVSISQHETEGPDPRSKENFKLIIVSIEETTCSCILFRSYDALNFLCTWDSAVYGSIRRTLNDVVIKSPYVAGILSELLDDYAEDVVHAIMIRRAVQTLPGWCWLYSKMAPHLR